MTETSSANALSPRSGRRHLAHGDSRGMRMSITDSFSPVGAASGQDFKVGRMSPLSGLPIVTAALLSHGYAVGYMTSPAVRARLGLPRCKTRPLT